jgi:hypothetical protein
MRLIKLSKKIFETEDKVAYYFNDSGSELRSRNDKHGVFTFPKGWIAEGGISPNETVLFSYKGNVVCVAKTLSERLPWSGFECSLYPYCLQIELSSMKMGKFPISDLERALTEATGMCKSLTAQGWPILPDSVEAEATVKQLIAESDVD